MKTPLFAKTGYSGVSGEERGEVDHREHFLPAQFRGKFRVAIHWLAREVFREMVGVFASGFICSSQNSEGGKKMLVPGAGAFFFVQVHPCASPPGQDVFARRFPAEFSRRFPPHPPSCFVSAGIRMFRVQGYDFSETFQDREVRDGDACSRHICRDRIDLYPVTRPGKDHPCQFVR